MVSTPVGFYESKPMPYIPYVSIKKPKLGNHFVNFPHHWMSNQRLPSTGYVVLNQIRIQLYQVVSCVLKIQSGRAIKKMNMLIVGSIIGFFATLKLFSLQ